MAPGILRKSPLPEGRTLDNDAKKEFGRSVDRVSPDELTEPSTEPIAIIGIGCRLPGGVDSPSKLWDLLIQEKSTQTPIPHSRFNIGSFYHSNVERPGSVATAGGHFLEEDLKYFDNDFFGINNLEAMYLDPEQRKLLEVVFECLENAGITMEQVSGADIGCYVGKFTYDYLMIQNKDSEYLHRFSATGMSNSILANRVSHAFNLQGPSLVIDTACSSAMYCLHMACTALRANECVAAIVAGANLIQSPEQHIGTMKAGILSPTSTCHTFDEAADGYARGESVGVLYLKRLSDAIRDGDHIRSVIRATAVNSDGHTPGITLPSVVAQEKVVRKAYASANLDLDGTGYVECHGTGTLVGDAIELEGLSKVFNRPQNAPLLVGSVKPNMGHSEAASAITSIIKVVLALENGKIPPTIGVSKLSPKIKADEWNIRVLTSSEPWPVTQSSPIARASVNSFGFGGANAHAVLESVDHHVPPRASLVSSPRAFRRSTFLLPFSAMTQLALEHRVQDLTLGCQEGMSVLDLAYTLADRRSRLGVRGYILAGQDTLINDIQPQKLRIAPSPNARSSKTFAFVYTGQGAQWPQMGQQLMETFPSFLHTIQRLDTVLQLLSDPPSWSIQEKLLESSQTSKINEVAYAQPTNTALQIALTQLLASWGCEPEYVVGHSSGEICAAYAAGHVSAEEAIIIAYYRGQACSKLGKQGAMVSIGESRQEATTDIEALGLDAYVRVACVNSPENITISGDPEQVGQLRAHCEARGKFVRELKTDGKAYHSHHMAFVGQTYQDLLTPMLDSPVQTRNILASRPIWISTVTGQPIISPITPEYWRSNLERPVEFSEAILKVVEASSVHFIELGPHSALEIPIRQTLAKSSVNTEKCMYSAALSRGKSGLDTVLQLMGDLYLKDFNVPFSQINQVAQPFDECLLKGKHHTSEGNFLPNLPLYKWQHDKILWTESTNSKHFRNREFPRHDILGSEQPGSSKIAAVWRNIVRIAHVPWLRDHQIDGLVVFPAAGYIAMVIEAARQLNSPGYTKLPPCNLQQIRFLKALVLSGEDSDAGVEIYTALHMLPSCGEYESTWRFAITSQSAGKTTVHVDGNITLDSDSKPLRERIPIQPQDFESQPARRWYEAMAQAGIHFSGPFRALYDIKNPKMKNCKHTIAMANFHPGDPDGLESSYPIHPATLDAILHSSLIATAAGVLKQFKLRIPVSIESIHIRLPDENIMDIPFAVHASAKPVGLDQMTSCVDVSTEQGQLFMQVRNCRVAPPLREQETAPARYPMLRVEWKPDITRMESDDSSAFSAYLESGTPIIRLPDVDSSLQEMLIALDLLVHKAPGLRILEMGNKSSDITETILDLLCVKRAFKRCFSYAKYSSTEGGNLHVNHVQQNLTGEYGFGEPVKEALSDKHSTLVVRQLKDSLSLNGSILALVEASNINLFEGQNYVLSQLHQEGSVALLLVRLNDPARPGATMKATDWGHVVLVFRNSDHILNKLLDERLGHYFQKAVRRVNFDEESLQSIDPGSIVISTVELENPIFSTLTDHQLKLVKLITDSAYRIFWLTGGGILSGSCPEYAIASAVGRSTMAEQPSLKFFNFDINDATANVEKTISDLLFVLEQAQSSEKPDFEFIQDKGLLHISRFVPDVLLNSTFQNKYGHEPIMTKLQDAMPCQLCFDMPGQSDTAYLTRLKNKDGAVQPGFVEVAVESAILDKYSFAAVLENAHTQDETAVLQSIGIVTAVGKDVSLLAIGDRVTTIGPARVMTTLQTPAWSCIKLASREAFLETPLLHYSICAFYALSSCARLQSGDKLLVSSGASQLGASAIRFAQTLGAEVFTIIQSEQEEDFVVEKLGLPRDRLFNTCSVSIVSEMMTATRQQGFQKIFITSKNNLLPAIWEVCGDFGCLVEFDTCQSESASALPPKKCVSFSRFGMHDLFTLKNGVCQRILTGFSQDREMLSGQPSLGDVFPAQSFDVSQVAQAGQYLEENPMTGRILLRLDDKDVSMKYLLPKYNSTFDPKKTYFLIGCLGGLGRSLSDWMFMQGARKFLFFQRSGLANPKAREFVDYLRSNNVEVNVVQGDVCQFSAVNDAIKGIEGPIGGVIQGAMGLSESLFTSISNKQWHTAIDAKVFGTWNVHNALQGKENHLDFFLLMSSISGSIGIATESNYSASNYFLDIFARHRRSLGLPAISVGLGVVSEVGYLHEHPDVQNGLEQKGAAVLDEQDFLQIMDTALASSSLPLSDPESPASSFKTLSKSHILTGLEPTGLLNLRRQGFEGIPATFDDPRALMLRQVFMQAIGTHDPSKSNYNESNKSIISGLPLELAEALHKTNLDIDSSSVYEIVLSLVVKQFSNFLLTPVDKIDAAKPLVTFGIDSLLAATIRTWFYGSFVVDLPFMTLLSQTTTIADLADSVMEKVCARVGKV